MGRERGAGALKGADPFGHVSGWPKGLADRIGPLRWPLAFLGRGLSTFISYRIRDLNYSYIWLFLKAPKNTLPYQARKGIKPAPPPWGGGSSGQKAGPTLARHGAIIPNLEPVSSPLIDRSMIERSIAKAPRPPGRAISPSALLPLGPFRERAGSKWPWPPFGRPPWPKLPWPPR